MKTTIERLGVVPSFSRPRVSNDIPFRKPCSGSANMSPPGLQGDSRRSKESVWVLAFTRRYNGEHRHSAIRFVTPEVRHRGEDQLLLARRHELYQAARALNPSH